LALGYTLVTGNEREFSRIHDLTVENWLRQSS
jgi:predicted nucleic acid-binding protein